VGFGLEESEENTTINNNHEQQQRAERSRGQLMDATTTARSTVQYYWTVHVPTQHGRRCINV